MLLIRLLFLNFGDDTRMWRVRGRGLFAELVSASPESGQGLGGQLQELFQVLNRPEDRRPRSTPIDLLDFPYVNGGLFAEQLPVFSFTREMRTALLATTEYDWARISPAIFGAMFQAVKSKTDRRVLGEHYTSEANILKVIRPLFLDDLLARMRRAWNSPGTLRSLREELGRYHYLDPAAGCGNFLVVAYQRLREVELKLIVRLQELGSLEQQVGLAGFGNYGLRVHLGQFHAIEIDEWSSQIAHVAMYLADHQANRELEEITGASSNRFPLIESANIHTADALATDWASVCPMDENTVILGNPPFIGARQQNEEQKTATLRTWRGQHGAGELDFVANWFVIAARHIRDCGGRAAFVATNSLTQGEQPAVLWHGLYALAMGIDFAHRTFEWENGAAGRAHVMCVVIGFSARPKPRQRSLWSYATPRSLPTRSEVGQINAYLLDAPEVLIVPRRAPLRPEIAQMIYGSMPNDGGHLSDLTETDAEHIRSTDPIAAKYLRRLIGATELLNAGRRWCLWLADAEPADLRTSPVLIARVGAVRQRRADSNRAATRRLAERPAEFGEIRQPATDYLVLPRHYSSSRKYVPVARFDAQVITNDAVLLVPDPSPATFGWLSSKPFALWSAAVSGRIKDDYRVGISTTYNTFPFPPVLPRHRAAMEDAAQQILDARTRHAGASLADLYAPDAMPRDVREAHTQLDRATLGALGLRSNATDERVLARLIELYQAERQQELDAAMSASGKQPR